MFRKSKRNQIGGRLQMFDKPIVITVDGRAASGKTTFAYELSKIIKGEIIQMDDFFLPVKLRTKSRLSEKGGNIHYERFMKEVIPYIGYKNSFVYRCFDCSTMDYSKVKTIRKSDFIIIEGSYSNHPFFGDYSDFNIFMDITSEKQLERIVFRNGLYEAKKFYEDWIPMEELYFSEFKIEDKSDLIIRMV